MMRESLEMKSQQLIVAQHGGTAALGVKCDIDYTTGCIKSSEHLTRNVYCEMRTRSWRVHGFCGTSCNKFTVSKFEPKYSKKTKTKTTKNQNKTAALTELVKAHTLRHHMQLIPNYCRGLINAELKSENTLTITAIWCRLTVCGNNNQKN